MRFVVSVREESYCGLAILSDEVVVLIVVVMVLLLL